MTCTEPAYAKLNLTLDILGKRPDGYHDMRMVMQSVTLADEVSVELLPEPGLDITADLPFLPKGEGNIAGKAAAAFFRETGLPQRGLSVHIRKHIPVCAGMAGGSSDGAAVLRVLRRALAPEMSREDLEKIGGQVGSDVPYCIRGGTVLAEGRGEVLTDLPPLPPCWIVICKPDFGLPTGEMFARARGRIFQSRPDIDGMVRALGKGDLEGVAKRLYNVFEEVLPPETREEVQGLKTAMRCCGALNAAMSGSGPAMFGIFLKEEEAAAAAESLRTWCGQTFLVQPVERLDGPVV